MWVMVTQSAIVPVSQKIIVQSECLCSEQKLSDGDRCCYHRTTVRESNPANYSKLSSIMIVLAQ